MATEYANELVGVLDGTLPAAKADAAVQGGNLKRFRATVTLASQASGTIIVLAKPRPGLVFSHGIMVSSVSLGTATVKIGPVSSDAAYRAAAVFTAVDTPTFFGPAAAVAGSAIATQENIIATTAVAGLPASGTLVMDLYYSAAS